jgi:ABC-type glycerol-3-phosphate transport system substrate-binding protein
MKKIISLLLVASIIMTSTFAQGASEKSSEESEKVKMVLALDKYAVDHPEYGETVKQVMAMDKYKNVDFEILPYDPDYEATLPISVAGGEQRDILCVRSQGWLNDWAKAGVIIPIDEYVKNYGVSYIKNYGENTTNSSSIDGKIYAIPHANNQWFLYYNKAVFDKAGVPYPDKKIPMTWDEYNEIAAKLTSGVGPDKTYGALEVNWPQFWYGEAISALGGANAFYTKDGMSSNIEDPMFRKALLAKHNRMFRDKSIPTYADVKTSKTQVNAFLNGQYGMIIEGDWMLDWLADSEKYPRDWKVGICPMPVESGEQLITWGSLSYLTICKSSANPQLAYEIAKDIEDASCATFTGAKPNSLLEKPMAYKKVAQVLATEGITVDDINYLLNNSDIKRVREKMLGVGSSEYIKIMNEETELYFVDDQDLDTTIQNIKTRANKAIKEAE